MSGILYLTLIGLFAKHLVADYLTQTPWMIAGKGNLRHLGGYTHAAIHSVGTIIVLLIVGMDPAFALTVALTEFVLHYLLDFAKDHYSRGVNPSARPHLYWGLYGLDQTFHALTYVGIVFWVDLQLPPLHP